MLAPPLTSRPTNVAFPLFLWIITPSPNSMAFLSYVPSFRGLFHRRDAFGHRYALRLVALGYSYYWQWWSRRPQNLPKLSTMHFFVGKKSNRVNERLWLWAFCTLRRFGHKNSFFYKRAVALSCVSDSFWLQKCSSEPEWLLWQHIKGLKWDFRCCGSITVHANVKSSRLLTKLFKCYLK